MLVNRLMRQSQQERRIAVQLLQARHEKDVIRKNRLIREKQDEERRLKEFEDALNKEAVSVTFVSVTFLKGKGHHRRNVMMWSHWERTIPITIIIGFIVIFRSVHTAARPFHWCHWLLLFIGLGIGLVLAQCNHTIIPLKMIKLRNLFHQLLGISQIS